MRLSWSDLGLTKADRADGRTVEIAGWPVTAVPQRRGDYFLLTSEPNCCAGCVPGNPLVVIEVFATTELDFGNGALRLSGTWRLVTDDPTGWRYQAHR